MALAKSKTIDPWKAKRWHPIYAPKYLRSAFIGETPAAESKNVIGREVNISLAAVIGDMKKQNINVTFKITRFDGNNAITEIRKFEVSPSYIRRQIRKGRDRVDDTYYLKTSDKIDVVLKPLFVTKGKVNNSKKTLLRKMAKQELREYVSKITYNELVQDLVSGGLQKNLGLSLRKICPLRGADIRVMEILQAVTSEEMPEQPAENAEEKVEQKTEEEKPAEEKEVKEKAPKKKAKKEEVKAAE